MEAFCCKASNPSVLGLECAWSKGLLSNSPELCLSPPCSCTEARDQLLHIPGSEQAAVALSGLEWSTLSYTHSVSVYAKVGCCIHRVINYWNCQRRKMRAFRGGLQLEATLALEDAHPISPASLQQSQSSLLNFSQIEGQEGLGFD